MRLIDADALIDRLDYCVKEGMGSTIAFTFKHMVEEAPSIDIVRCQECKHRHKTDRGITYCDCITYGFNHIEDDFCSHGEREGE